jgi:hypothetical protein
MVVRRTAVFKRGGAFFLAVEKIFEKSICDSPRESSQ